MPVKTCFKCLAIKDITEFYTHPAMQDGRLGKCKDCTKHDVAKNRHNNTEHYRAYERERTRRPQRRKDQVEYRRRMRNRHPEKYRARVMAGNAIRDGRLLRQLCEVCGAFAEAHHDNYAEPLNVRWLCRQHHVEHHGANW